MRERVVVVVVVLVVVLTALVWWVRHDGRSTYERALDSLPAASLRAAFTDWNHARTTVEAERLSRFIEKSYNADLTRSSALEDAAVLIDRHYGLSLRDAEWEVYGQADEGSVDVLRVSDSTSYDDLRARLRKLGYDEPRSATASWAGTVELVARLDPSLTPVMQNLLLLEDQHLVLFSDSASYAEDAAAVIDGSQPSLRDAAGDLAGAPEEPVSAILWASDFACGALAMSQADASDQTAGQSLVQRAGGVSPLDGLVMARNPGNEVTVAMQFESSAQASSNLQPRTNLASGDAPGLGGSFRDRFKVIAGKSEGNLVVLQLAPVPGVKNLLSLISSGPVLFATC